MSRQWEATPAGEGLDGDVRTVVLAIPTRLRYQLIYAAPCRVLARGDRPGEFPIVTMTGPVDGIRWRGPLMRCFGPLGFLKTLAKLASSTRRLVVVPSEDGAVSHYSWVMLGRCRQYHIGTEDAVIGPIWTDERCRGRGYAWAVIKSIAQSLAAEGISTAYIDTSNDNLACQSTISKAGFGAPIGVKPRG